VPYINLPAVGQYNYDAANKTYTPQAGTYLAGVEPTLLAYYEAILAQEQGNLDRALARLQTDYNSGMRISQEDYTRNKQYGQESYAASVSEQALTNAGEQRTLASDLLKRGVSQGGLAAEKSVDLKSRQDLRREAIDRALRKSEQDLSYTKERAQEDVSKTSTRGGEDVASDFAKFKLTSGQEQREKSLGLAEQAYQREFSKQATEKGFDFSQQSLNKM
jgi:hypothetical protein